MFVRIARWLTDARCRAPRPRPFAAPCCEPLEDRTNPSGLFVAGVGGATLATDPEVSIYATAGPRTNQRLGVQLEAFATTFGDTRVAVGDVNGDGTDDVIAAAGKNGGSQVVIFDGAQALRGVQVQLASFFVYSDAPGVSQTSGFSGGVFVAAEDLNGDGFDELITTPGRGGRGHLKVFDFNNGSGTFLASTPTLRTSAYTFTDYNGEIRVTSLRANGMPFVVTASGAGVPGDVRVFQNVYNLGQIPDLTPVPLSFLRARLVPFNGYANGLSVAAGDTDGDGNDELFISKNDGAALVEIYDANIIALASSNGVVSPPPLATFNAFQGFLGEVRLGAADVNGDGKVEVLTTTGFSGDPQGTPVKAFTRTNFFSVPVSSFYSNPGYLPGAWLAGKDFTFAQDLTSTNSFLGTETTPSPLPRNFSDGSAGTLLVPFPMTGTVPPESVTGAGLPFQNAEVSFAFDHALIKQAKVTLRYLSPTSGARDLVLYDGASSMASSSPSGLNVTITDDATTVVTGGTVGATLTGRFLPVGGSLASFIRGLPDRNGTFYLMFQDSTPGTDGTVRAQPAPRLRLLY